MSRVRAPTSEGADVYVGTWAERTPDKPALIFVGGEGGGDRVVFYSELDRTSNQVAHFLRDELGLAPGAGVAAMLENVAEFAFVWWAAMRAGLYFTPLNWHLTAPEVGYVLSDSGAAVLFYADHLADVAAPALSTMPTVAGVRVGDHEAPERPSDRSFAAAIARQPTTRLADETSGAAMFYSSGTTGRPKGIRTALSGLAPKEHESLGASVLRTYGITSNDRYLSPGPLYHSSPSIWSFGMNCIGATAVIMRRFDATEALATIERQRITVSQWVPTMFTRLLKLPPDVRTRYDLSSHRVAYHAAAPCPIEVKRQMIEWWGPIIEEFYAGTEGGSTHITSEEWLAHPGSVGRHWTGKQIHILDPATREPLPQGQEGLIFFEALTNHRFAYHNAPEKTAETYHENLVTLGDIGYLDADGYLYLTDRQSHMIISGGVNIYPREIEEVLVGDPRVDDVAVIGVPNDEMGEEVKAVVQLRSGVVRTASLADELIARCRSQISRIKCPRSVDFVDELPRDANGKLYKRHLREKYWSGRDSRLV